MLNEKCIFKTIDDLMIIATLREEKNDYIMIEDPLTISIAFEEETNRTKFYMSKYNTFSKQDQFTKVYTCNIISTYQADDNIIQLYTTYLEHFAKMREKQNDSAFHEGISEFQDALDEEEDEQFEIKNRTLH